MTQSPNLNISCKPAFIKPCSASAAAEDRVQGFRPRAMFGLILSLLYTSSAASAMPGRSLRGAEDTRQLQSVPDSTPRVGAPQCEPGYVDVTMGNAFYPWACASSCAGGQWFATADCNCACARPGQPIYSPPASGSIGSVTSNPAPVTTRPQTTMAYVPVQPSPPPSYVAPEPRTTLAPTTTPSTAASKAGTLDGGDFPVAAAAVVAGGLLLCGAIACMWLATVPQKSMADLRVAEVPAVTVHAPAEKCPQPNNAEQPPRSRTSSKMSTVSVSSDRALIPGSRVSSQVSCNTQSSVPLRMAAKGWETSSTTSSTLPPTIVNSTLWAHHVDGNIESMSGSESRQLTPERSRGSSKLSRVEPDTGSRRSSKSSSKSSGRYAPSQG